MLPEVDRSKGPVPEPHMRKNHLYVLGINAYDHDVSACLLRDGEIAFAINKERITREKHDTGFYQEVVDYCLSAESISLDDVDLVVRNCYVLPVEDLETRMVSQDVPEVMDDGERRQASKNPLFLSRSNKVITVSHHLAHAYSAFAVSPFHEGAVMVVDGVGNYASDVAEPRQLTETADPLARESESYYRFHGSTLETLKKFWLKPSRGFLSDEFLLHAGPRSALQPGVQLHLCRLEQVRRGHGPGPLWPPARRQAAAGPQRRGVNGPGLGGGVRQTILARAGARLGSQFLDAALERRCLAGSR